MDLMDLNGKQHDKQKRRVFCVMGQNAPSREDCEGPQKDKRGRRAERKGRRRGRGEKT